ncbi:MAG: hypothetical protein K5920_00800 [Bacteroidales bacterium]|nr:hypothetical protein [Bacteroidales bacterium]
MGHIEAPSPSVKENLRRAYDKACNDYLQAFCKLYELDFGADAWVGGDVGTVAMVGDYFFNFDDIRLCVDNGVKWKDLIEWYDYCAEALPLGLNGINLKSWLAGAPRSSKETIEKIKEIRRELDELINKENSKNRGFKTAQK